MISFYIEETATPVAKEKYVNLCMEKDGKKYIVDCAYIPLTIESDTRFQETMSQLYSTDGAYCGSEEDIVEFTDRIRSNDYHFEEWSQFGKMLTHNSYYAFFGRIIETKEEFEFRIFDVTSPEIARAKIDLLLKERKK